MAQNDQQMEKERLKLQFESMFNQRKESEQHYRRLHRRLMDHCDKRIANAELIENHFNKEQFKQLCYLNKRLIENNITMTATDITMNASFCLCIKVQVFRLSFKFEVPRFM